MRIPIAKLVANTSLLLLIPLLTRITLGCPRGNGIIGYQCEGSETSCIPLNKICDGNADCPSADDETNCTDENASKMLVSKSIGLKKQYSIQKLDMSQFKVYSPELDVTRQNQPPIPFIAYQRSSPDESLDAKSVVYEKSEKIVVYTHGYATTELEDGVNMKDALFEGTLDVDWVVLIDWRRWSVDFSSAGNSSYSDNYKEVALQNVPRVALRVREWLLDTFFDSNNIYLIGFSLGAHISATASRKIEPSDPQIVDRISGLDPAGPIFEHSLYGVYPIDKTNTIRVTDAPFMDIIHASSVLGISEPAGHLDIYLTENICPFYDSPCTHKIAFKFYISSLTRCSMITCPYSGRCGPNEYSELGYLAEKYGGKGNHILKVENSVLGWEDEECSEFKNVYLKAKDRVCYAPPNDKESSAHCKDKPYLTTCMINCGMDDLQVVCDVERKITASTSESVGWQGKLGDCEK